MTSYGQNYSTPRADFSHLHGQRPGPENHRDGDDDDDWRRREPILPFGGTKVFDHKMRIASLVTRAAEDR